MAFLFISLNVYQKALNLTDKITILTESFPRGVYYLSDQLNHKMVNEVDYFSLVELQRC